MKLTCHNQTKMNKFAMISEVGSCFIENCISCYKPGQNITINEELFPRKTRSPFIQFIELKPNKYVQKF